MLLVCCVFFFNVSLSSISNMSWLNESLWLIRPYWYSKILQLRKMAQQRLLQISEQPLEASKALENLPGILK